MMNISNSKDFIRSLDLSPPFEELYELGDRLGAILVNQKGDYEQHVYVRGPILYALISKLKPKTVLEFGTAGGYSALCMARAMVDNNIDGKIFTIDRLSMDFPQTRNVKDSSGNISTIKSSNNEHWPKVASKELIEKIIPITGYTGQALNKIDLPKIEFSYIDAAHDYEGVKHDFYSLLNVSAKKFDVLFDDYINRPFFGITKFVDEEIKNNFDVTLIQTDEIYISSTEKQNHGMIWFSTETAKKPLSEIFPHSNVENFLKKYRRYEKYVVTNRHKLNTKIPYFTNVKFKFWKKSS